MSLTPLIPFPLPKEFAARRPHFPFPHFDIRIENENDEKTFIYHRVQSQTGFSKKIWRDKVTSLEEAKKLYDYNEFDGNAFIALVYSIMQKDRVHNDPNSRQKLNARLASLNEFQEYSVKNY